MTENFSDQKFSETGAGPSFQLHNLDATYILPKDTWPDGFEVQSELSFEISREPDRMRKKTGVWNLKAPFPKDIDGRVSAPEGMAVFVDGDPAKYSDRLVGKSWKISQGVLSVAWKPPVKQVTVKYNSAEKLLTRMDPTRSELSGDEYSRFSLTIGDRTQQGLILPANSTASWKLTVPANGRLEATVSLVRPPLRHLSSDGAQVQVVVTHEGEQKTAFTRTVYNNDRFTPIEVDLSEFSGKEVSLTLKSAPFGSPDWDYLFVGHPTVYGAPDGEVRRVVVIGMDTTRPDAFGFYGYNRNTTPELDAIARSSVVFERAWTPAPRTRPSFRSATTGRRPLEAVGAKNIAEVFSENGFATAGFVANVHLQPRFGFNKGFDDWQFRSGARSEQQVDAALEFLSKNQDHDSFTFLHIMDPHIFYNAPGSYFDMFVEEHDPKLPEQFNRWIVYEWMSKGKVSDVRKQEIRARYDGELRYTSAQLGRFFDQLDRMPGKTLVVVHNDHGEEFWEHGGFEHNHTLADEVTRGLLWMRSGAGAKNGKRIQTPATLMDIAPTLFDLFDLKGDETDGISLKSALFDEQPNLPIRPIGIAHLRYGRDRWGVVTNGHKYILHTGSGKEELFAIGNENINLARKTPLAQYRKALGEAHQIPVGRGWRVRLQVDPKQTSPWTITLPEAATEIVLMDPELAVKKPANQAWGEPPTRTLAEIGSIVVSEDKTQITWQPGTNPTEGVLLVLFNKDVDASKGTLATNNKTIPMTSGPYGFRYSLGRTYISFEPGTVLIPPMGEAQRMKASSDGGDENIAELCALGYLSGSICDGH